MSKNESELQRLREKFGLTRRQVSDLLNVSEMSIYRAEKRLTRTHPHIQKRIDQLTEILTSKERGKQK